MTILLQQQRDDERISKQQTEDYDHQIQLLRQELDRVKLKLATADSSVEAQLKGLGAANEYAERITNQVRRIKELEELLKSKGWIHSVSYITTKDFEDLTKRVNSLDEQVFSMSRRLQALT